MAANPEDFSTPGFPAAQNNLAGSQGVNPQAAQQAIETEHLTGIPASVGMHNPTVGQQHVQTQQSSAALETSPPVQKFASRSPAHAAAISGVMGDVVRFANSISDAMQPIGQALKPIPTPIDPSTLHREGLIGDYDPTFEGTATLGGHIPEFFDAFSHVLSTMGARDAAEAWKGYGGPAEKILQGWRDAGEQLNRVVLAGEQLDSAQNTLPAFWEMGKRTLWSGLDYASAITGAVTDIGARSMASLPGPVYSPTGDAWKDFTNQLNPFHAFDYSKFVPVEKQKKLEGAEKLEYWEKLADIASIFAAHHMPTGTAVIPFEAPNLEALAPEPLPPKPGPVPLGPDGLHPVDSNGQLLDSTNQPYRFKTAREAAKWQMDNVNQTATGQQFNPMLNDDGTFTIREASRPSIQEPPVPGASTKVMDDAHKELASLNLQKLETLQKQVADLPALKDSPVALKQLLNDAGMEGKTVSIKLHTIMETLQKHFAEAKYFELVKEHGKDLTTSYMNDSSADIPLADYIALTAGRPWAAAMNQEVGYGAAPSAADVEKLTEKPPKAEAPPEPPAGAPVEPKIGPWTMEDVHKGGVFHLPRQAEEVHITPSEPERDWTHTLFTGNDEFSQTYKEDLLKTLNNGDAERMVAPVETPKEEGILPENQKVMETLAAKIDNASSRVVKERSLDQLFAAPKSLELGKKMYGQWADKVETAFQEAKASAFQKVMNRISKDYKTQWNDAMSRNLPASADDVLSSRGMMAQHALRFTDKDLQELVKDNEFAPNGNPIHFWNSTDTIGLGVDPAELKVWGLKDLGIDPNFAALKNGMMSYAQQKEFAKDWFTKPVKYLVHLKAKPGEVGDFRRPEDLKKARDWYAKKGEIPTGIGQGAHSAWANEDMMKDLSWKAVRTVKDRFSTAEPNITTTGDQSYVRYMMPETSFHPHLGLKYEDLPPEIRAQFSPEEFAAEQRYFKGKYADMNLMSLNTKIATSEKAAYKDLVEGLPKSIWARDGITADQVAKQFGYGSGRELLEEIASMERDRVAAGGAGFRKWVQDTIKDTARQRTLQEVGNLLDPQKILDDTRSAFNEPHITSLLEAQLQDLARQEGRLPINPGDIRADVLEKFDTLPARTAANVRKWELEIKNATRDMERGLVGDKPISAFEGKQRVLQAQYRLEAAHEFRRELTKGAVLVRDLKRLGAIDKMDPNVAAIIQQQLQDLKLGGRRNPDELARYLSDKDTPYKNVGQLVNYLQSIGMKIELAPVPQAIRGINEERVPWDEFTKNLSKVEFQSQMNMLKALAKEGREWNQVKIGKDIADMNAVAEEVRANAEYMGGGKGPDELVQRRRDWWERNVKPPVDGFLAAHTRVDMILRMMDKGERGILTKTISDLLQDGKYLETSLLKDYHAAMTKFPGAKTVWTNVHKPVTIPEWMHSNINGHPKWIADEGELLRAASNLGTYTNRKKLFEGYGLDKGVWDQAEDWIIQNLRPEHEEFLKAHWNWLDKLFPKLDKAYMEDRGYGLKKEVGRTVALKSGTIQGAYTPLEYDKDLILAMQAEGQGATRVVPASQEMKPIGLAGGKLPANGFSEERTNYNGPIDLNPLLFRQSANEAVHDLAFRGPLRQATKLLDPNRSQAAAVINQSIQNVLGREYQNQLLPWLDYIALEHLFIDRSTNAAFKFGKQVVNNIAYAHIAAQIQSPLRHGIAGAIHSITEAGGDVVGYAKGIQFALSPYGQKFMREHSGEIANLDYNADPILRDIMGRSPYGMTFGDKVMYLGTAGFRFFKNWEAQSLWATRYLQETGKHGDSAEAIRAADQSARDSQGAGHPVDQPAAMRSATTMNEMLGYGLSRFLTFLNTTFNRNRMAYHQLQIGMYRRSQGDLAGAGKYGGRGAGGFLGYTIIPAIVGSFLLPLVYGRKDPKDSKSMAVAKELGWQLAENTIGTTAIGNLALSAAHHYDTGGQLGEYFTNAVSAATDWGQPAELRKVIQTIGEPFSLPDAAAREAQNVYDLYDPTRIMPSETDDPVAVAQRWAAARNSQYSPKTHTGSLGGGLHR